MSSRLDCGLGFRPVGMGRHSQYALARVLPTRSRRAIHRGCRVSRVKDRTCAALQRKREAGGHPASTFSLGYVRRLGGGHSWKRATAAQTPSRLQREHGAAAPLPTVRRHTHQSPSSSVGAALHLRQVCSQGPVDAAALDAEHNTQVHTAPLGARSTTLGAQVIPCHAHRSDTDTQTHAPEHTRRAKCR
jgi:hypothetical protein